MDTRMDMIELLPGSMKVYDMKPDDVGTLTRARKIACHTKGSGCNEIAHLFLYVIWIFLTMLPVLPCNPQSSQTSQVVLRFIWFGADFSAPVQKTHVIISTSGYKFSKPTTRKGWLVLSGVPCNRDIKIVLGQTGFIVRKPGESRVSVRAHRNREIMGHVPCSEILSLSARFLGEMASLLATIWTTSTVVVHAKPHRPLKRT